MAFTRACTLYNFAPYTLAPLLLAGLAASENMVNISRSSSLKQRITNVLSSDHILPAQRDVHPGIATSDYGDNAVISAKYTWINMFPKAIYNQFRRLSNFYFLIVAAVSFIPDISPSSPVTTTLPLIVVIGFGLARDVFEDLKRKRADQISNSRPILIRARLPSTNHRIASAASVQNDEALQFLQEEPSLSIPDHLIVKSQNLFVGDIVLIREDEQIPADVVVLASSEPNGECYVSTANLDGESALKRRYVPPSLRSVLSNFDEFRSLSVTVTVSEPNPSLYGFEAVLSGDALPAQCPLDDSNLLLRGSILRNTNFVYAVVVYNGSQTKLSLNMRNPPSKLGGIERMLNRVVIAMFGSLLVVTVIVALVAGLWQREFGEGQWYMGEDRLLSGRTVALRSLGTFLILFHTFVPVSLFVTLEFVRLIQGIFISSDKKMCSKGMSVDSKANNLNETLGYVEHIFSDKTGTLTENVMRFLKCSAGGSSYDVTSNSLMKAAQSGNFDVRELLLEMALTHDVMPKVSHHGVSHERFQGESPDEVALVQGAADMGVELLERSELRMVVRDIGESDGSEYEILAILEFSSVRKRMSIVLRCPDRKVRLFSKGADSVMTPLLSGLAATKEIEDATKTFSSLGLRTLVYASRVVAENEWQLWKVEYEDACNAMSNRTALKEEAACRIEHDLDFTGVTAVEDKLQDNVPATISFLRAAGIRIWVLTGDKVETAENIGYSSRLLSSDMNVLVAGHPTKEEFRNYLLRVRKEQGNTMQSDVVRTDGVGFFDRMKQGLQGARSVEVEQSGALAMIIDGKTLDLVDDEEMERLFIDVAIHCKTLICARVTPLQKASVVKLVRKYVHSNTLAIGDGGNDVSMIQEAHIGVGIKGKEGTQAARAADYTMGEFQHLSRLLAVHGRFSYIRTAGVINLSLYKNVFFSMIQILFQFYCFGSGTTFHNQWIVTGWNSVLTLMPPFFYGLCERDLEERTVLRFPSVYQSNWRNRLFSIRTVMEFTIAYSVWHGVVVFFLTYFAFGDVPRINFKSGLDSGFYLTGLGISIMTLCVALFKFLLSSHLWTSLVLIGIGASFSLLWILILMFPIVFHELELEGVLRQLMSSPSYHLLWPVVFVTAFLPDFLVLLKRIRTQDVVGKLQFLEVQEGRDRRGGRAGIGDN